MNFWSLVASFFPYCNYYTMLMLMMLMLMVMVMVMITVMV